MSAPSSEVGWMVSLLDEEEEEEKEEGGEEERSEICIDCEVEGVGAIEVRLLIGFIPFSTAGIGVKVMLGRRPKVEVVGLRVERSPGVTGTPAAAVPAMETRPMDHITNSKIDRS